MKPIRSILQGAAICIILISLAIIPFSSAMAFTEGPNNPASGTNLPDIGTEIWSNPENITSPGSPYASVILYNKHTYSNYLQGMQYGFAIPAYATITGIEVRINRMSESRNPNIIDNVVSLVKGGAIVGENKALTASAWPTAFTLAVYGGEADLWGTSWTPAEINSTDFGLVLAVQRDNNGNNIRSALVDSMQITIYYEFTSSTSVDCGINPSITYGESITCLATVSRLAGNLTPSGTVSWTSDGSGSFEPNPCDLTGADGVVTCSATYTPSAVGTGAHLVTATYNGDDYFGNSTDSKTGTVLTRPVTVTANPQMKAFGSSDPELTYEITEGSLVFNDTFTGTLTREAGEDVGTYAILQGSLALPTDYSLTYVGDFLTIIKADPDCQVTPYAVVYDGNPHSASGACIGVFGESLTGLNLDETIHTDAGVYSDTWTFTDQTGNYNDIEGTVVDAIDMADAVCTVFPYDAVYDGIDHIASGSCTGLNGEPVGGLDLSGTIHMDAGTYSDPWTFSNINYNDLSGTVEDVIHKAEAVCSVTPYDVIYDGIDHTATGACTGVNGAPLVGLDLSGTTHQDAGTYTDSWTFTDVTGNYYDLVGSVVDHISKANAFCVVTPYDVTYDGGGHSATGSCSGVNGETLEGLDLSGTTHTNAGTYSDPWTFTDATGNYNDQAGSIVDHIASANATCTITAYDVTYDGEVHTATGSCIGVNGEILGGLDLNATSHMDAGSYTDPWIFTDMTGNYYDQSGTVEDTIGMADAMCEVLGYTVEFDREAHQATGTCTGVQGEVLPGLDLSETSHAEIGSYPDDLWLFSDANGNYNDQTGNVDDEITVRFITITADAKVKKYGETDPLLTFEITYGSLLSGDTFTGSLTRVPGNSPGTYAILLGTLSLPDYYELTYLGADLTITGFKYLYPMMLRETDLH